MVSESWDGVGRTYDGTGLGRRRESQGMAGVEEEVDRRDERVD
jgi:hypothetical protein